MEREILPTLLCEGLEDRSQYFDIYYTGGV